jgi:hypothetical protein
MVNESPAGSYALSRQPTVLPTVRFSPATSVEFIAAANKTDTEKIATGITTQINKRLATGEWSLLRLRGLDRHAPDVPALKAAIDRRTMKPQPSAEDAVAPLWL